MKAKNKTLLVERAVSAIENLYHNATPRYPRCQNDAESDAFQAWFEERAAFEIYELDSIGAYGNSVPKFENLKSERAREYARRKYRNDRIYDQARGGRHELITEYGKLYQYGRGGRTLAPKQLIKTLGGSRFTFSDIVENLNTGDLTELVLTVEAFNRYVEQWNTDVPNMWRDAKEANGWNFDQYDGKTRRRKFVTEYI